MLRVDGIQAGYGSVQILNGVSLGVERGRIASLLGGNGTGKSTLLKTVSGLLKPWQGTVEFDGERIDGLRALCAAAWAAAGEASLGADAARAALRRLEHNVSDARRTDTSM